MLPDVPALDRVLDYVLPDALVVDAAAPVVGTIVRVPLQSRRERGWVVATDRGSPPGVRLRAVTRVSSRGPGPELVELAGWAAWRWAGRRTTFLRAASPLRSVGRLPASALRPPPPVVEPDVAWAESIADALVGGPRVLRLPPDADPLPLLLAATARGQALILTPAQHDARQLVTRLRRAGVAAVHHPERWADAAAGVTVVGSRAAAWAPAPDLAVVVVLDEHDERYQDERAPTWHARDVVVERARRAGVPCVLVSPIPTLEALAAGPLVAPSRAVERQGWPVVEVIDRRRDPDPLRSGLYSERLGAALRSGGVAAVILNRKGRAKLLACNACRALATCDRCGAALAAPDAEHLSCPRCGATRPPVCAACGATRLKLLRLGVSRMRDELEALLREPVVEVTAETEGLGGPGGAGGPGRRGGTGETAAARVFVGTEALLHRLGSADVIAFPDLDGDLLAPRYRSAERVLAQLTLAARRLGGRGGSRLVLQTRQPDPDAVRAVLLADPGRFSAAEDERRRALRLPPHTSMAVLSGPGAVELADRLRAVGAEVRGPADDRFQVRAANAAALADHLAAAGRPPDRVRIAVDPLDV